MYTPRIFKDIGDINRMQINPGHSYTVVSPSAEDGFAIHFTDNAYIMTENGATFEVLSKPNPREIKSEMYYSLEVVDRGCKESLDPETHSAWEIVKRELKKTRGDLQ